MKKAAAALAVIGVLSAGCSTGPAQDAGPAATPAEAVTPTTSPYFTTERMPDPTTEESPEVRVMENVLLREGINLPPGLAADYADAVCTDLEAGLDPMGIAFTAHKHLPMYDIVQHAMMIGASAGSHCPEYGYIIEQMGE